MSYTIENINGCTKKIVFDFQTFDLGQEIKSALMEKQKTVNIKGFRKGKTPLNVIEQLYRPQIENDALMGFITNQYAQMIKSENLRPVGYPSFSNTKFEKGDNGKDKKISFEAIVEIFPEIHVKGLDSLSFPKETPDVKEEEIKAHQDRYLHSKAVMTEITDSSVTASLGHFAAVNFDGAKEDGVTLPGLKAEDVVIEIGSGKFLPDFENGIVGMKTSEKKNIPVTFPGDYHEPNLKGAKVNFQVELLELKERKVPELTDELAKEFGYESLADFNKKLKDNIHQQKEREIRDNLFKQILEKLIDQNSFDLPTSLVMRQKENLKDDLKKTLQEQSFTEEMVEEYFQKWDDEMNSKAEFQVRSGLILDQLSKEFNIETTDEDLEEKFDEVAASTGVKKEEIRKFYQTKTDMMRNLHYRVREEKTFNKILQKVNFT